VPERSPLYLLLPLASAILYVASALLIKRAGSLGAGVWRTQLVTNVLCALFFLALLPFGGTFHTRLLWQPALVGLLFFGGQLLTLVSLDRGDVSVATPVLSLKIVMVAFFSTLLLGTPIALRLWIAAALSTVGVAMLSRTRAGSRNRAGITILSAGGGALGFALFDVLVMKWSPQWGMGIFLPAMMGFTVLYSLPLIPFFPSPLRAIPRPAWPWLLGGGAFFSLQSVVFVAALAAIGNGTSANVVYATRGMWSVVAVWLFGRKLGIVESGVDTFIMLMRLMGAALLTAAVILVMLG
jgi:drug/metabolite transporter (DMT)-like permease